MDSSHPIIDYASPPPPGPLPPLTSPSAVRALVAGILSGPAIYAFIYLVGSVRWEEYGWKQDKAIDLCLVLSAFVCSLTPVILSFAAFRTIHQSPVPLRGRGLAALGIVIDMLWLVLFILALAT